MIIVDDRWTGQNGIGRYAKEVLGRLTVPWAPIAHSGRPSSPADFLTKRITVGGRAPSAIYSPGYNGFLRAVPQTITLHDLIHLEGAAARKYRPYYNGFLKPLIKRNGHVLTVSETSRRHIEEWLGDSTVSVINAGNACSDVFSAVGPAYSALRPYYMYVGNLRAHKNVETIVEAMKHLNDADLYLVTSDRRGAGQLAALHGVDDRVKIFDGIDDAELATLYRGARATLQPSLLEGFGLPALEAARSGSPVIFFDGCESVREICAGGGIPVGDSKSVGEWSTAMLSVQDGDRFPVGRVSTATYSWDRVASNVSETLGRYSS